ncbi:MAG: phage holin family protein [Rikenellaceae bacterium]
METWCRYFSGALMSLCGLFAPITPLVWCVVAFIAIDFVTGNMASMARARREGKEWYFRSYYAWRTIYKLGFSIIAIGMAWLIDECVMTFVVLNLARFVAGFVCGVEMWSFLENAAQISNAPLFRWLQRFVYQKVKDRC